MRDGARVRLRNGDVRILRRRSEKSTLYDMFPWSLDFDDERGQHTGVTLTENGKFNTPNLGGFSADDELDVVEILPETDATPLLDTSKPLYADPATLAGLAEPEKYASGGGGKRFSEGKLRFDLTPYEWVVELARVNTEGAKKYGDSNWLRGMNYHECLRGAYSHLTKWQSGQDLDHETGCHHLAHVAWNVLALMSYEMRGLGVRNLIGTETMPAGMQLELDSGGKWATGTDLAKKIGVKLDALPKGGAE